MYHTTTLYGPVDLQFNAGTFTPRQLYPCGKSPRFSPNTKLGGALQPAWTVWRREQSLPPPEIEPPIL